MKPQQKPDFYAVVSAIAKFIELTEKTSPEKKETDHGN